MQPTRNLWRWLAVVFVLSFAALGWLGREIYLAAPPIPTVKTEAGATLFTKEQVQDGQRAWLAAGGQQLGTVWGHGSYVAPDWSADWLHREALALREIFSHRLYRTGFATISAHHQASVDALVKAEMRRNTYDAATDTLVVGADRAAAIAQVQAHYTGLFGKEASLDKLREQYAMMPDALPRAEDRHALAGFFFWSAWSAATDRPGEKGLSYTRTGRTSPSSATSFPPRPPSGRS